MTYNKFLPILLYSSFSDYDLKNQSHYLNWKAIYLLSVDGSSISHNEKPLKNSKEKQWLKTLGSCPHLNFDSFYICLETIYCYLRKGPPCLPDAKGWWLISQTRCSHVLPATSNLYAAFHKMLIVHIAMLETEYKCVRLSFFHFNVMRNSSIKWAETCFCVLQMYSKMTT